MFEILSNFFIKNSIDCFAPIPLGACRLKRPYLLERAGICTGSVVMMAIPYYSGACHDPVRNLSSYAVSRDYHLFFSQLFDRLLPVLRESFPQAKFCGFTDHSPIDEIHAAATAGLGVIGQNGLLITPNYSSYVFLGELITDLELACTPVPIQTCENCGACRRACPAESGGVCLSALTQKKGALTDAEKETILAHGSVWGCDLCQEVCPHTKRAMQSGRIFSPIPYFSEHPICHLSAKILNAMSEEEFCRRAYAWRGRDTIARNLKLFEEGEPPC